MAKRKKRKQKKKQNSESTGLWRIAAIAIATFALLIYLNPAQSAGANGSAGLGGTLSAFGNFLNSLGSEEVQPDLPATTPGSCDTTSEAYQAELTRFKAAISRNESDTAGGYEAHNDETGAHGKYQILADNWPSWAVEAGLTAEAPQTPENQEIVAGHKFTMYYTQFCNWRDVAIAWFAGPNAVGNPTAENRSDGISTVRNYADLVVEYMQSNG